MKKDYVLERVLEHLFLDKENVLVNQLAEGMTEEELSYIDRFHPDDVFMVERPDAYFCGLRADHFVVEVGEMEAMGCSNLAFLISANHKGSRGMTLIYLKGKEWDDED